MNLDSLLEKIETFVIKSEEIEGILARAGLILINEIDSYIEEYSKNNTTYRPLRSGNGDFKRNAKGKRIYGNAPALIDTGQYRSAWNLESKKDFNRIMAIIFNDKEYAKYLEDRYLVAHIVFDRCKDDIIKYIKDELEKLRG